MIDSVADAMRMFAAASIAPGRLPPGAEGLHAVGWATVELERAVAQLARVLGVPETAFVDAPGSAALGAHCRIAREPIVDDLRLAILEPSTEGRLAAALARWDEGPLVAWYATTTPLDGRRPVLPGPFGPERLVGGDPLTGPHRLVVVTGTGTMPA
jgi:hypothetical protein